MYKEILKDKEEFWNVPTNLIKDSFFYNEKSKKGMMKFLEETSAYTIYMSKPNPTTLLELSRKTREAYEDFILNCVDVSANLDVYNYDMETNLYRLIYWGLDMVDWTKITIMLVTECVTD